MTLTNLGEMRTCLTSNNVAQPLYYAASVGVAKVVEHILPQIVNVNAQGGRYGNALQATLFGCENAAFACL
jgi:hypothetical protein